MPVDRELERHLHHGASLLRFAAISLMAASVSAGSGESPAAAVSVSATGSVEPTAIGTSGTHLWIVRHGARHDYAQPSWREQISALGHEARDHNTPDGWIDADISALA